MKCEIDCDALTPSEVAEQMTNGTLGTCDEIEDVRLDGGTLLVSVRSPLVHGYFIRTERFTICDIRKLFVNADYCEWGKDEDGEPVLLCFGCC